MINDIFFSSFKDAVQSQRQKLQKIISSLQNRHIPAIATKIKENLIDKENLDKNRTKAGKIREKVQNLLWKSFQTGGSNLHIYSKYQGILLIFSNQIL